MSKKKDYLITFTGVGQTRSNHAPIRAMFFDELDTEFDRCIFEQMGDHPYGVPRGQESDATYEVNVPYHWFTPALEDFKALYKWLKEHSQFSGVTYHKNRTEPKITFTYQEVEYTAQLTWF